MFNRIIIQELKKWVDRPDRKPLVIRGARQTGKTTVVNQFASHFDQYIYLNLELTEDRRLFEQFSSIEMLVQALFFIKNKSLSTKNKTLIFIDEIQEVPEALNSLRYFMESEPGIAVIAAGSMLESLFDNNISFPVGRVEFMMIRPASFPEFLDAMGETAALEQLQQVPLAGFAHDKLLQLFHTYALIGGMPEIVSHYSKYRDLKALSKIFDSLLTSYLDDVEKYASSVTQINHIRHAIRSSFLLAGKRIKFEGFGNSTYRSRDMSEALRTIEKALLIHVVHPSTDTQLPVIPDNRKSPRLHVLDSGLMNYFLGIQKEVLGSQDLNAVYQGKLIEHLVGQELLTLDFNALSSLYFWVREKKTSTAEVDYLFSVDGKIIPVEVKSGSEGKLRSLHLFMDQSPQNLAIRFYAGKPHLTQAITLNGKKFNLLNLPYYLVSQIKSYFERFSEPGILEE
jgi:predicted AAA+ superfamily ATPase